MTYGIRSVLFILAHPSIGSLHRMKRMYLATTDYENGVQLVRSLGDVVQSSAEDGES